MPPVTRVAAMLFVNAKGELLLQLRDDKPDIRFPNHWGVIGGRVEPGESYDEALVREVEEEIEETVTGYDYWDTHDSPGFSIAMFAARLDKPAAQLTLHEGQRVEFVSPQEAMMLPLVPWLAEVLPAFVRSGLYRRLCPDALPVPNEEAASIVFVNRRGELLLRLRDDKPGLLFPAMWDLIGGAMEDGETPLEAAIRESKEEISVFPENLEYWDAIRGVVLIHVCESGRSRQVPHPDGGSTPRVVRSAGGTPAAARAVHGSPDPSVHRHGCLQEPDLRRRLNLTFADIASRYE